MSLYRLYVAAWILASLVLVSCRGAPVAPPTTSPTTPPPVTPTPPAPITANVTIELAAGNLTYNLSTITVPAGAGVTIVFRNNDSGVPHNFSVYQNLPGGQTRPVFVGFTITGPGTARYRFPAPNDPADYFFECDVHPLQMNGKFIVSKPGA